MMRLFQFPAPGSRLLFRAGDEVRFELRADGGVPPGRAVLRTNLGGAKKRRRELVEAMDAGRPPLALDWSDVPMEELPSGPGGVRRWAVRVPLVDIGCFSAKACFLPDGGAGRSVWPEGSDVRIKVSPSWTAAACSVYCAFPRQFGAGAGAARSDTDPPEAKALESRGWTAIPPGGTFRDLAARLDEIVFGEGFRILQLLPVHPVPTTFARMGRFGSPFAGTDFFSVDPALARFDESATPLDQFRELVAAVHARGARLFLDLPANHTGWASALQTHFPDWFKREPDGRFHSPGAWGVVWADLVELDHSKPELRSFLASVFEFWCLQGVDGFRCDAGYMVPAETWRYVVARVRESFPDTVFLLEGLGGKLSVTDALLGDEGLDWAYSEIFQTCDRSAFERYLPEAEARSAGVGPLVHFAETHDNARLAARSKTWARARTALAALASRQGCWGVTCGVEWFADEKVDVHGASAMRWGAAENQVAAIRRLNAILAFHPAFGPDATLEMVQRGPGNTLALLRRDAASGASALVLANLDPDAEQPVAWSGFDPSGIAPVFDTCDASAAPPVGADSAVLPPGRVACFARAPRDGGAAAAAVERAVADPPGGGGAPRVPPAVERQSLRLAALRLRRGLCGARALGAGDDVDEMAAALARDPLAAARSHLPDGAMLPVTVCDLPEDAGRVVPLPHGNLLLVRAPRAFRARMECEAGGRTLRKSAQSFRLDDGSHAMFLDPPAVRTTAPLAARIAVFGKDLPGRCDISVMPPADAVRAPRTTVSGAAVRTDPALCGLLGNGRGAMSHARAAFGAIRSQYDALFAANPDPRVPCDRIVLLPRCRAWIVNHGFSTPLDESCQTSFEALPGLLRWRFDAPAGAGRVAPVSVSLSLVPGRNRIALDFSRESAPPGNGRLLPDAEPVQLVVRPDVESRSFHETTKAFLGPEREFPDSVRDLPDGFVFAPPGRIALEARMDGAKFVREPEWRYMQPHPDDAARGLDGSGDLFSPGWFDATLGGGTSVRLSAFVPGEPEEAAPVPAAVASAPDARSGGFVAALSAAARAFLAVREDAPTVIAGYPWFLDWGRDTFIALRGAIADGLGAEALAVARKFAAFVDRGTLPNMICGRDASNRDTSDAPLWFCVVLADLVAWSHGRMVASSDHQTIRPSDLFPVVLQILNGYLAGTPNGIRVDPDSGLVFSPPHFTWMDTNHPAGTPREGYPVEIQALWIHALGFAAEFDPDGPWKELRAKAAASFLEFFALPDRRFLSDCLHSPGGFRPAAECTADDHLRCNQLFAVVLGAVDPHSETARGIVESSEKLLVPGAIRTLAPGRVEFALPVCGPGGLLNDPNAPYWGRYEGDEDTRRKPAYHNGTAWPWPFPAYAEALVRVYGDSARPAAASLLCSVLPLLESGCIGHLPEIVDGDAPHFQRGCDAQAWSATETLRVARLLGM